MRKTPTEDMQQHANARKITEKSMKECISILKAKCRSLHSVLNFNIILSGRIIMEMLVLLYIIEKLGKNAILTKVRS